MNSAPYNKIFLDMDGVLTDFMNHCMNYLNIPEETYFEQGVWDTTPAMAKALGISTKEFWNALNHHFWATMPQTWFANELLRAVYESVGPNNVRILSAPACDESAKGKLMWLEHQLPELYNNKQYHLTHLKEDMAHPNHVLIDDRDKNILAWQKAGGIGLLVPTKYNSRHKEAILQGWLPEFLKEVKSRSTSW